MKKYNKKFLIFGLVLLLALPMLAVSLPMSSAQTVENYPSFVYAGAGPDPVGVGQQVVIVTWTAEVPPVSLDDDQLGSYGNRAAWKGLTATITEPDGAIQTISFPVTDPVGGTYYIFTPTKLGKHTVVVHFPETTKYISSTTTRIYAAADSEPDTFDVVADKLEWIPAVDPPKEYWTRPIFSNNRDWATLAGSWLNDGLGNPYTKAPETAHIVWTKPTQLGGIVGEPYGQISFYEGTSYEQRFGNTVVVAGILIYHQPLNHRVYATGTFAADAMKGLELIAVDLRTGEELWRRDGIGVTRAMIYEYSSPNQHGAHAYLWAISGTSAMALDPFTGHNLFNVTNIPSGTDSVGPNGEWIRYVIGGPTNNRTWLALWNSTAMISMTNLNDAQLAQLQNDSSLLSHTNAWQWRPVNRPVHNGSTGYSWNISLPSGLVGSIRFVVDNMVFGGSGYGSFGLSVPSGNFDAWGVEVENGVAKLLFNTKPQPPSANVTLQWEAGMINRDSIEAGIFLMKAKETVQWIGYDLATGQQKWISEPESGWMMYSRGVAIVGDKFYSAGYGGEVYAYDLKTGHRLWTAQIDPEGLESVYERAPLSTPVVIDGKIYVDTQEHSYTHPYYRTWKLYCFDAETGERIWDIAGSYKGAVFADGYMTNINMFDMQIYTFGKGPTATTVTAPNTAVPKGTSVLIEGKVIDISAGTKQDRLASRFPNGVPAVSDESMTDWMEYVYMQMPQPNNTTGVRVHLTAYDPQGNPVEIGTTTTDSNGKYGLEWTPTLEGTYHITATFEETKSYWPSMDTTYLVVGEASAPAPTQTTAPTTSPTTTTEPTSPAPTATSSASVSTPTVAPKSDQGSSTEIYIAIAAAVIIIAIVAAAVALRRHK